MPRRTRSVIWLTLVCGISGCAADPSVPSSDSAAAIVQTYCYALTQHAWPRAHATLHPDCRATLTVEDFVRLAGQYQQSFGFSPEAFHVRSCQEQGDDAIAHIVWNGHEGGHQRSYKDGLVLRRTGEGWRIVLPRNYGQPPPRR